jgi:HSP20 family molecular chaperone IbpA
MTTKIITTNNTKPFIGTVYGSNQLPALFNDNWFNSFFKDMDKAFESPGVHYPYDILVHKTKEDNIPFEYEVHVALAGLTKEDIKIQVKENKLVIKIDPQDEIPPEDHFVTYLRTGISYRNATLEFSIAKEVETEHIRSKFKDGLLKVYIPITKPTSSDIIIDVD